MRQDAIEKINAELQMRPEDEYLEIVGHYVIDRCAADDGAAGAACKEGKTLKGCMAAIEAAAQQKERNNVGVVSSVALYALIDTYFEFCRDEGARQKHAEAVCTGTGAGAMPTAPSRTAPRTALLDFDDFL